MDVGGDLVEVRGERVVELERTQIGAPAIVFLAVSAVSVILSSVAPNRQAALAPNTSTLLALRM